MAEFIAQYGEFLLQGVQDTLYMSLGASVFAYIIGIPLGVILYTTKQGGLLENKPFNIVFGWTINMLRSIPFLILIVQLMPFTRLIAGKAIGASAALVPLTIGAAPFVARMVETSLEEIDKGVIEACLCMGASPYQIITKVLISESLPSILRGASITCITLIGYSTIAGAVGAGGLGDIAIRYGYHRNIQSVMNVTIILLIIIVSVLQILFSKIAQHTDKRKIG